MIAYIHVVMTRTALLPSLLAVLAFAGCSSEIVPEPGDFVKGGNGKADSSAEAVFLDFEFDGSFVADSSFNPNQKIEDQLLYTIGDLNGDRSVGRLDKLELSDVETKRVDGRSVISYHAKIPVAWGKKNSVPSSYSLALPADMGFAALDAFAANYGRDCVDFGAHDVDQGSMWYYYRPERSSCRFADGDVVETTASVSLSSINTTGKFPEYHKVWEDDVLKVVAIFGKYEDGATSNGDAGIAAYNTFSSTIENALDNKTGFASMPLDIPSRPGVDMPEVSYRADLADGRSVEVVALLVDNIRTAPAAFNTRYEELTGSADLIAYNGHAGLGANVRAMARKGKWEQGQYSIVFLNGCDTYAYVDSALADAHADANPDDPHGTKYMDIVTNAMPSFFRSMPDASMALINGLLRYDDPQTYESMFRNIDSAEVVLVSGEQDNEYVPGFGEEPSEPSDQWQGIIEEGTVVAGEEHRFVTPTLKAGRYLFEISGDEDADLYVRIGHEPTTRSFDCRPYLNGSDEQCTVEIATPAPVHVMVRGWNASSQYILLAE